MTLKSLFKNFVELQFVFRLYIFGLLEQFLQTRKVFGAP